MNMINVLGLEGFFDVLKGVGGWPHVPWPCRGPRCLASSPLPHLEPGTGQGPAACAKALGSSGPPAQVPDPGLQSVAVTPSELLSLPEHTLLISGKWRKWEETDREAAAWCSQRVGVGSAAGLCLLLSPGSGAQPISTAHCVLVLQKPPLLGQSQPAQGTQWQWQREYVKNFCPVLAHQQPSQCSGLPQASLGELSLLLTPGVGPGT